MEEDVKDVVEESPAEAPVETLAEAPEDSIPVDSEKVEFTEGVKFLWRGKLLEYRRGDVVKVSRELRDVLLARECVKLKA